jgi:L-lysine exporter family protein LysE/ArgO
VLESYLTGLIVCGGIIVAIGAQNAYLLSQAIRREHHWWSAGLCMVADITLFTLGMFGISAALMAMPEALEILRWLGVAFLGWLAIQSFVRAGRGRAALEAGEVTKRSLKAVVFTTLAKGRDHLRGRCEQCLDSLVRPACLGWLGACTNSRPAAGLADY